MSAATSTSKHPAVRAPDDRFRGGDGVRGQQATLSKIDISSLQLVDSYEDDGDPYNNTGRHLIKVIRDRRRD